MEEILDKKPNAKEVKKLIKLFKSLRTQIATLPNRQTALVDKIKTASSFVIEDDVCNTLKTIPIEEVNRGDLSIKLASYKKRGLNSYYDVYQKRDLARMTMSSGIGTMSLYEIQNEVLKTADEIRKHSLPTLNADKRNKNTDILVSLLYIYVHAEPLIRMVQDLDSRFGKTVVDSIGGCNILLNGIKWMISGKKNKVNAIMSYFSLKELVDNNMVNNIEFALSELDKLDSIKPAGAWKHFAENSARYYTALERILNVKLNNYKRNGLSTELAEDISQMELGLSGLKCTLRSYQEFGVKYIIHQGNVLLGDEMGLGKTVQAIGAMVALRNLGERHFFVVCPASVLINWCRELSLHSDLVPYRVHGDQRDEVIAQWKTSGGVAVTTFETLAKLDLATIPNVGMLVVDEAHYIKNPKAIRTKNLISLKEHCSRTLFMTGTPLENNVDEMQFLIKNLQPDIAKEIDHMKHLSSAKLFKEKISPVYFRRTREDVLKELPDLIENEEWCEMTELESSEYRESVQAENFMGMRQVSWQTKDIEKSSKGQRLLEIYEKAVEEKRKIVVFSFFLNTLNQVQKLLGDKCIGCITGAIPPEDRQKMIDKLAKAPDGSVLVAQIQAGGTGVNIQAASMIVICEPQLKPSIENQAISRAYRMGQVRNVLVYRLLCDESVDERIMEILENKQNIFDSFADKSVMGEHSMEITDQATKNIIAQEKERIASSKK